MRDLGFPLAASNFDPPKKSKGKLNPGAPRSTDSRPTYLKNPTMNSKGNNTYSFPRLDNPVKKSKGNNSSPSLKSLKK